MRWIFAAPLVAASVHVLEEFVYPGGFRAWYARYRPEIARSLTVRLLVTINAILLTVCALLAVAGPSPANAATWLIVVSVLFWNAIFHVRAALRMRRYSPGVVSGILLYVPLALYGYPVLVRQGLASVPAAALCFAMGGLYAVWSLANHRRRARRKPEHG